MKIIWKYIFINVKERKMRTAVMLLSILLSTTLLFVSFSIGASYESAQRKMARGMAGSATLSITAAEGTIRADILPNSASIRASVGILEGSALYHENGYYETVDLIAATILMVPLLTNLLSMGLERLYGIFLGNEDRLAARNMRENKNIVQNITLLFISISAVIAITVVGDFVTTYVSDVFNGAELQGFADGRMEPEFVEQIRGMDGIEKVLPIYVYQNQMQANGITLSRLEVTDNLDWYSSMLALHYTQSGMKEQAISAFAGERAVLLSESCIERTGLAVGDTLTLTNGAGNYDYLVAGSFKSRATDVEAIIPASCAVSDFGASVYRFFAYTAADPDAIMVQLRDLFGETSNWSRTVEEFNADALSTVGAF